MFDPRKLTPAQRKAVIEIGDWNVWFFQGLSQSAAFLFHEDDEYEWTRSHIAASTFRSLIRHGIVTVTDEKRQRYRLTPEAAAWAKEQNDDAK